MVPTTTNSTPEGDTILTPEIETASQQPSLNVSGPTPVDVFVPSSERIRSDRDPLKTEWFPGVSRDNVAYIDEVRSMLAELEPTELSKAQVDYSLSYGRTLPYEEHSCLRNRHVHHK